MRETSQTEKNLRKKRLQTRVYEHMCFKNMVPSKASREGMLVEICRPVDGGLLRKRLEVKVIVEKLT